MFNVLSGLQEGSHSVMVTSRPGPAGLVKGTLVALTGSSSDGSGGYAGSGTIAKFDTASSPYGLIGNAVGYIFEDLTTQTSGKYTVIYGSMEVETDQFSGSPAIGSYLKPGTGATAGLLVPCDVTIAANVQLACAQVVDSYSIPNDAQSATGTAVLRCLMF